MVNNYPEYAAGVNYKKTDSEDVRHFYSAQVVADPDNETVSAALIKDGVVIDEGGGATVEALNVTENGTYSEEGKAYSPVVVNVPAAASDFSTAEVTIYAKNTTAETHTETFFGVYAPCVLWSGSYNNIAQALISFEGTALAGESISSGPIDIILYKGKAKLPPWQSAGGEHFYPTGAPTVTGDITIENDDSILITGPGTITFDCDYSE